MARPRLTAGRQTGVGGGVASALVGYLKGEILCRLPHGGSGSQIVSTVARLNVKRGRTRMSANKLRFCTVRVKRAGSIFRGRLAVRASRVWTPCTAESGTSRAARHGVTVCRVAARSVPPHCVRRPPPPPPASAAPLLPPPGAPPPPPPLAAPPPLPPPPCPVSGVRGRRSPLAGAASVRVRPVPSPRSSQTATDRHRSSQAVTGRHRPSQTATGRHRP